MNNVLIIQTAFIGDAILATSLLETIHKHYPNSNIDVVVRKGNENLFEKHPFLNRLIVWNKKEKKYKNLFRTIKEIRKVNYDLTLNLQRFANAGFMTVRSKSKCKIGYKGSLISMLFSKGLKHEIGNGKHEIERNFELLRLYPQLSSEIQQPALPKLHIAEIVIPEVLENLNDFVVLAPASVWETKKLPSHKWVELIQKLDNKTIIMVGAPGDSNLLNAIKELSGNTSIQVITDLSLIQSAKLISKAERIYANDSAPLHIGSATNTPVTAFFCSTIPAFGFGPLSENSEVIEIQNNLECRPCGLHGFKSCPKGHFKCGNEIVVS